MAPEGINYLKDYFDRSLGKALWLADANGQYLSTVIPVQSETHRQCSPLMMNGHAYIPALQPTWLNKKESMAFDFQDNTFYMREVSSHGAKRFYVSATEAPIAKELYTLPRTALEGHTKKETALLLMIANGVKSIEPDTITITLPKTLLGKTNGYLVDVGAKQQAYYYCVLEKGLDYPEYNKFLLARVPQRNYPIHHDVFFKKDKNIFINFEMQMSKEVFASAFGEAFLQALESHYSSQGAAHGTGRGGR